MPEELENQEPQETQNNAPEPEDLEDIKAQLEQESQARADVEATAAERDTRIATLEAELIEAKTNLTSTTEQLTSAVKLSEQAAAKYLDLARTANPTIPGDVIAGASIEEIEASVERGKAIVEAVRKSMAAEASATRVPAGAPTRGEISTEGMSPREKIVYGIQKQGGISA